MNRCVFVLLILTGWFQVGNVARADESGRCKWGEYLDCRKKCNAGDAGSCETLCMMYYHGPERLTRQFETLHFCNKGCEGNFPKACLYTGMIFRYGEGMYRNPLRALTLIAHSIELYDRECSDGKVMSCIELAKLYQRGHANPDDYARAAGYYARACFKGHAESCDQAAQLYMREPEYRGRQKNPAKAVKLWEKGCGLKNIQCCAKAGRAYAQGQGVLRKPSLAAEFFGRACEAGDPRSCNSLGHQYIDGVGVFKNIDRGVELLRWACERADEKDTLRVRYCADYENAEERYE
jgi:TPR repeat protein